MNLEILFALQTRQTLRKWLNAYVHINRNWQQKKRDLNGQTFFYMTGCTLLKFLSISFTSYFKNILHKNTLGIRLSGAINSNPQSNPAPNYGNSFTYLYGCQILADFILHFCNCLGDSICKSQVSTLRIHFGNSLTPFLLNLVPTNKRILLGYCP